MKHQPPSAWAPWESHTTHPRTAITITGVLQNVIFTCAIELTLYWWIWSGQYYWKLVKYWSIDLKIFCKDYRHKASHEVNLGIVLGEREGVQIIKSSPHQCWGRRTIDAPAGRSTLRRPLTVQCWNTCASKTLMSPDLYLWYLKSTLSFRKSDMAIITCWLCVTLRKVCCASSQRDPSLLTRMSSCCTTPVFLCPTLSRTYCCPCAGSWWIILYTARTILLVFYVFGPNKVLRAAGSDQRHQDWMVRWFQQQPGDFLSCSFLYTDITFSCKNWPMHTPLINTTLLALCYSA